MSRNVEVVQLIKHDQTLLFMEMTNAVMKVGIYEKLHLHKLCFCSCLSVYNKFRESEKMSSSFLVHFLFSLTHFLISLTR